MPGVNMSSKIGPELDGPVNSVEKPKTGLGCSLFKTGSLLTEADSSEVYIKTTLRELIQYSLFLFTLSIVSFGMTTFFSQYHFYHIKTLRDLFSDMEDVRDAEGFWQFAQHGLLKGLYSEEWYNEGRGDLPPVEGRTWQFLCPDGNAPGGAPCSTDLSDRGVLMENRLLGLPRLRQIKVLNSSCEVPEQFQGIIRRCFDRYSPGAEDRLDFGPGKRKRKYTSAEAWAYRTYQQLNSSSFTHFGKVGSYPGDGFTQLLPSDKKKAELTMAELKQNLWVEMGTRVVFIDFSVYNANMNMFAVVKLVFEFPASGGVLPKGFYTVMKLIRYRSIYDYFIMASEFLLVAFLIFYCVEEVIEIRALKKKYFHGLYNNLDYVVIVFCFLVLGHRLFTFFVIEPSLKDINVDATSFIDFTVYSFWSYFFDSITALTVFFAWCKLFKYISFNSSMTQLSGTLNRASGDLTGFFVMFCIIFFAFIQLGYLLFGAQAADYSSMYDTTFTLIRTILGDFNFLDIAQANRFFGPLYFICFVFFVFFVLLNMFLAILSDAFGEVKAEIRAMESKYDIGDFFRTGYINIIDKMGARTKKMDIEEAHKMTLKKDYTGSEGVRTFLKSRNFGEAEIEVFITEFELDVREWNTERDDSEGEAGLEDVKVEMEGEARPLSGKHARQQRADRIQSARSILSAVKDDDESERETEAAEELRQFEGLIKRVDKMEYISGKINKKIDMVLARLEDLAQPEPSSKQREQMSRLMDDFMDGKITPTQ